MIVAAAIVLLGLFIGSFLNVCIYRIPRSESIVWPGSRCTACGTPIKPWDNIPVVSYLFLRGRCRYCQARIKPRYPLVEALSALLALALYTRFGMTAVFVIYYLFACALIVITFIDLDFQIIPDSISIGGIALGLVLVYWLPVSYRDALVGLVVGAGSLVLVIYGYYFLTRRQGMGGGDVKLLGMIGVFTGWQGVAFTIFTASLIGSVVGLTWIAVQHKDMKAAIPFGPFLSLGALIYLFWGPPLIAWYFMLMRP